jgi:hypothetical protein
MQESGLGYELNLTDPASRSAGEQGAARAAMDDGEGGDGCTVRWQAGGGAVVHAVGDVVRVAARRNGPCHVDDDVVGDGHRWLYCCCNSNAASRDLLQHMVISSTRVAV